MVVGVGNPYRRDDGVGAAVLEELRRRPGLPGRVRLVDSDGEPSRTIVAWQGAEVAVVVDAVRTGAPAGTIHRVPTGDAPSGGRGAGSHALGPGDAVRLGRATGRMPGRLELIGVEVADVAMGVGLTEAVAAAVPVVADLVLELLEAGAAAHDR